MATKRKKRSASSMMIAKMKADDAIAEKKRLEKSFMSTFGYKSPAARSAAAKRIKAGGMVKYDEKHFSPDFIKKYKKKPATKSGPRSNPTVKRVAKPKLKFSKAATKGKKPYRKPSSTKLSYSKK